MGIYKYLQRETFVPNSAHTRENTCVREGKDVSQEGTCSRY